MEISWFHSARFEWGNPPPEGGTLSLNLTPAHRLKWQEFLDNVLRRGVGKESRMSFVIDDGGIFQWTLFLKEVAGSTQGLLAHPEKMDWVGTLRLNTEDLKSVRRWMDADVGSSFNIFQLLKNKKTSNFNLLFNFIAT